MIDIDFIELFLEIDANKNGVITKNEMKTYLINREFSKEDVEEFLSLFEHFEEINYSEFCAILGRDEGELEYPTEHDSGVEIINSRISDFHQQWKVTNIIRRAFASSKEKKELAAIIKKSMDKQMGQMWHCVIVSGQYWAFYSHEEEASIAIKYKDLVFILFKTPCN